MDTETLIERITRLERESRRLKVIGAVLFLVLTAVGTMGQALPQGVPKRIEAEEFVVRDPNGKLRVRLSVLKGAALVSLLDQSGTPQVALTAPATGGAELWFTDQNGKFPLLLSAMPDGNGGVPHDVENRGRRPSGS